MSGMSDLFDSLDAGDLDEIAGKLNVTPKKDALQPQQVVEEVVEPVVQTEKKRGYIKFDNLNSQVEDLFENYVPNEETTKAVQPVHPSKRVEKKPLQRQSFVESAARAISHSIKNQPKYESKPLRETVSVEERIKLLEQDLFRVQAQATPNTLVAGIGASLDSGGGAVWLWDLEDVHIGTPFNGAYPDIADGAVLSYDRDNNRWEAGTASGGGGGSVNSVNGQTGTVVLNSADVGALPLTGGTMTGNIVFASGQPLGNNTTPGILSLVDDVDSSSQTVAGSAKAVKTAYDRGSTGVTDAATAKAVADAALPLTGGAITGDVTYAGDTSGNTNLQTKASVNTLIAGATGGNFVFKGTTDVTGAAPGSPAAGDFYINTVAGTADSSWTGIADSSIAADQLIIYSGSDSRWFAGAVEDNSTYLQKTGGTMSGQLKIDRNQQASASNNFIILGKGSGGHDTQLFKTYITSSATNLDWVQYFGETGTNDAQIQTRASVASTVSNYLPLAGGTVTGVFTVASGGDFVKERHGDDATKDFVIQGATTAAPTVATGNLLQVYRNTLTDASLSDVVSYFGGTTGDNNIQTKTSVQALIAASAGSNLTTGGTIDKDGGSTNTSGNLTISESSSSSNTGRLYVKGANGDTNVIIYPTGDTEIGDRFTLGNATDTNANKVFRFIGTSSPNVKFYFGQDTNNLTQSLTVNGTGITVIGNLNVGTSSSGTVTNNATISSAGAATFKGDITCTDNSKGVVLKSPNGTSFRLSVANDGTLSATAI